MSRIDRSLRSSAREWQEHVDARARQEAGRRASVTYRRQLNRGRLSRRWPVQLAGVATLAATVGLVVWLSHQNYVGSGGTAGSQGAACAAPELQVGHRARPVPLVRGERVTVTGRYYLNGCNDSGGGAAAPPIHSVRLSLTPRGGQPISLATARPAGELGTFRVSVTVPRDAPTGRATLDGGPARALTVVVR